MTVCRRPVEAGTPRSSPCAQRSRCVHGAPRCCGGQFRGHDRRVGDEAQLGRLPRMNASMSSVTIVGSKPVDSRASRRRRRTVLYQELAWPPSVG